MAWMGFEYKVVDSVDDANRLADEGFSLEELKDAVSEHRLALLPVDRVLGGSYTAAEVHERTGMPAASKTRKSRQIPAREPYS